ncbi:IPT/TIG domain-containing protein [Mucilaginibacter sp. UYCu711]|uniref:IPT/TIG domain-containing protein n=1 Tax=Mucilaginibacter sp. UYCu711 TaxID=3156339 RepID=UPI003D1EB045
MIKIKNRALFTTTIIVVILAGCSKSNSIVGDKTQSPETKYLAVIYNISPTIGVPNTVVKITGSDFNTAFGNNTVTLNGLNIPVNSVTDKEIVVTIPPNASKGNLIVTSGTTVMTSPQQFTVLSGAMSTVSDYRATSYAIDHIAIDRDGIIYGNNNNSIYKIASTPPFTLFAGGTSDFTSIAAILVKPIGDLYVANLGNFNIAKVTPTKQTSVFAGSTEGYVDATGTAAKFSSPTNIAVDGIGNVYVTDLHRIRKITNAGVVTTLAGSDVDGNFDGKGTAAQFGFMAGITSDIDGNVYVTDKKYLNVRKITPDGVVTTLAGSGTAGLADGVGATAQFNNPKGIAIDQSGNVFVTDENKSLPVFEIRVINKLGWVSTLIKGNSSTGVINGPTASAAVNSANGLTFDPAGNLYIVNTGANVISKVTFQ